MRIAVAILNWNGKILLERFLSSIVNYSKADIYVIDNASEDESIDFVRNNYPTVNLICFDKNLGFAKGYNEAIKQIDCDIVCLLNSDVEVSENWIEPVVKLFESNSEIAAIQPKIIAQQEKTKFEYAGAGGGFIDNLGYPYCRGRIFWSLEDDQNQYDNECEIFWGSGASLFIRKELYQKVGGLDEDFVMHQEEIDLCWRLKQLNYKIYYCGLSKVFHVGAVSLEKQNPKKTFYNFRNNLLMLMKNLPTKKLFAIIFARLVLDGLTAFVFLRYEGFNHFLAIGKAHFSFYWMIPKFLKKRTNGFYNYYDKKFIPFQYFIQKRKKYNQLK